MTNPMAISTPALGREMVAHLPQVVQKCAGQGRHRQKEGELRRRGTIETEQQATHDRRARARHARHERQHLTDADGKCPRDGSLVSLEDDRRGSEALDHQNRDAADDEGRRR